MHLFAVALLALCELTAPIRKNLESCLWSLVSYRVGIRGTFVVHVKTTVDARFTYSIDDEPWRDVPHNACVAVAHDCPGCAWKAIGPFMGWRISAE